MKITLTLISILLTGALAHAADQEPIFGSITCTGERNDVKVTLGAERAVVYNGQATEASLQDVTMTFQLWDDRDAVVGRAKYLRNDENYKPKKYKEHFRFDMTQLTEVTEFGRYLPGDDCNVNVMMPFSMGTEATFKAPVQYSCEQNGGVMTLDCNFVVDKRN